MPYRRPYKRARYGKRLKYSVQNKAFSLLLNQGAATSQVVVPATALEGMRKVKHLQVNLTTSVDSVHIWWALVYVPQGTEAGELNVTSGIAEMYEPNQYVMNCGIVDPSAGPIRFSSPIARNLNSGDAIQLCLVSDADTNINVNGTVRYAITLQ